MSAVSTLKQYIPKPLIPAARKGAFWWATLFTTRWYYSMKLRKLAAQAPNTVALHLGCGTRYMPNWINVDILPHTPMPDVLLDVTKPFPLADNSVQYIFTEDLIEHVSFEDGKHLLQECYRMLKPGGVLRVGTPDLQSVAKAYLDKSPGDLEFFRETMNCQSHAEWFNAGLRAWGHQFIYDEDLMTSLLKQLGFSVKREEFGESTESHLRGIDLRNPLEGAHSMYFDARKP